MKIHVEFSGLSDMAAFTKFINDSLVPPTQKELKAKEAQEKSNVSRLEQLLDRALERIAMLDPNGETAHLSPAEYAEKKRAEKTEIDPILLRSIEELPLTCRIHNCLVAGNIATIGQLVACTDNELLKLPNFGRKSLRELKDILKSFGLNLRA